MMPSQSGNTMNEHTNLPNSSLSPVEKYISALLGQTTNDHVIYRTLMRWDENTVDAVGESTTSIIINPKPDLEEKNIHTEPPAEKALVTSEAHYDESTNMKSVPEYNNNKEKSFIDSIDETADAKETASTPTPFIPIENNSTNRGKKNSGNKVGPKADKKSEKKSYKKFQNGMEKDYNSPKHFLDWLRSMDALEGSKLLKKRKKKSKIQAIIDKSIEEPVGVISESYALILARQGHIEKAIEMLHQLSLKNPEKSSYFAAQIEKFKNL